MALNWVMLDESKPHSFIPLPGESTLFASPARTTFQLNANGVSSPLASSKPGQYCLKASGGVAYITTQRVIYIPTSPTSDFESFSTSITSIHDAHVTSPLFGPNLWVSNITPTPNGNLMIDSSIYDYELKLTFKDGGAFEFHDIYEQMKEKIQNAIDLGEDIDVVASRGLDDLPSYQDSGAARPFGTGMADIGYSIHPPTGPPPHPDGPPPGYEEAQMQGLQQGFAERG